MRTDRLICFLEVLDDISLIMSFGLATISFYQYKKFLGFFPYQTYIVHSVGKNI